MSDRPSPLKLGLTDAELAVHPTVFASDALKDQVVIVSGGAGGIGRAIVWLFARLGAQVAVVGRTQSKLDALVAELAGRDLKASAHVADIKEPGSVNALFDAIWAAHGRIDCLINSAGGQFPQAAIDFSVKGWNAVINTNLNGTWYMMQVPFRLVLMTAFQPFTEKSIAACGNCPPALLMRQSMRPCAAQIASNSALTEPGSLMSAT